jgi:hypothetical protein
MMAERIISTVMDDIESSLVAPEGMSNEKANKWITEQKVAAKFLLLSVLHDYFSNEKGATKKSLETLRIDGKEKHIEAKTSEVVFKGVMADIVCKVSSPARSVNADLVRGRLAGIEQWDESKVQTFIDAVTTIKAPSRTLEVRPHVG